MDHLIAPRPCPWEATVVQQGAGVTGDMNRTSLKDIHQVQNGQAQNRSQVRQKTHTHTHTHATMKPGGEHKVLRAQVRFVQVERVCPLCRV